MPATDFGDYLSISFNGQEHLNLNDLNNFSKRILPFAASPLCNVDIIAAEKLTTGDDVKAVYDVTFKIENLQHEFEPGDTVGILPYNDKDEVDQLLNRLNIFSVAYQQYTLNVIKNTTKKKAAIPTHIPANGTLHEVFLRCIDIRSIPKKLFLRSLIRYTTKQEEIDVMESLCSPSGSQQYNDFISKNRTFLHLLKAFPSCNPPVTRILENLPPLQPRAYSISSSPLCKKSQNEFHITFAVIDVDKNTKGVCTGWLENYIKDVLHKNTTNNIDTLLNGLNIVSHKKHIPLYFRQNNSFRLPMTPTTPIIMIGPGTGLAPFIGFLDHRNLQSHINFGTSWLFYGCRYNNRDFLYKNKLDTFLETGALTKLSVSFSRENIKKQYVQDLIIENRHEIVELIKQQCAVVYICGDAKNMAKDIRNAVVSCLVDVEKLSVEEADGYIKEMERTHRYVKDLWL